MLYRMTHEPTLSSEESLRSLIGRLRKTGPMVDERTGVIDFHTPSHHDSQYAADVIEGLLIYKALAEKLIVRQCYVHEDL